LLLLKITWWALNSSSSSSSSSLDKEQLACNNNSISIVVSYGLWCNEVLAKQEYRRPLSSWITDWLMANFDSNVPYVGSRFDLGPSTEYISEYQLANIIGSSAFPFSKASHCHGSYCRPKEATRPIIANG
jgi:hypothetical protein